MASKSRYFFSMLFQLLVKGKSKFFSQQIPLAVVVSAFSVSRNGSSIYCYLFATIQYQLFVCKELILLNLCVICNAFQQKMTTFNNGKKYFTVQWAA